MIVLRVKVKGIACRGKGSAHAALTAGLPRSTGTMGQFQFSECAPADGMNAAKKKGPRHVLLGSSTTRLHQSSNQAEEGHDRSRHKVAHINVRSDVGYRRISGIVSNKTNPTLMTHRCH